MQSVSDDDVRKRLLDNSPTKTDRLYAARGRLFARENSSYSMRSLTSSQMIENMAKNTRKPS